MQAAAPTLEKTGVVIALEPLAPAETNFLTSAAEGRRVGRDGRFAHVPLAFGLQGDGRRKDADSRDLIHKYRKLFVHFHANDPNRQGPGFGKLDFVPIMKALAEIDYRGWVSVEPGDFTPGVERLARESIEYLRRCAEKTQLTAASRVCDTRRI